MELYIHQKHYGHGACYSLFLQCVSWVEIETFKGTDISTIEFNGIPNTASIINIYDIFGRKVKSISLNNTNKITISRDQFVSGIYLYHIISDNTVFISGKFEMD